MIPIPRLPYPEDALEPYLSAKAMREHLRAHQIYVEKLNAWLDTRGCSSETDLARAEYLARQTWGGKRAVDVANQAINHELFWGSITPEYAPLDAASPVNWEIQRQLGGYANLRRGVLELAESFFGSGWIWLVVQDGRLALLPTSDAHRPPGVVLWTLDLWEHSWWLNYPNERKRYAEAFLDRLVDWKSAERRLGGER